MTERVRPQPGPQEMFLASSADIAIYGGAAGGGKTYGLTLEAMRHVDVEGFGAIVFRRLSNQLTGSGSIWQEAAGMYPIKGGEPRLGEYMDWTFPSGATIEFSHLQQQKHIGSHLSKQYALIIWDQLEQFEEVMFWELFGRNRSTCGVTPYMRAACTPDPECFLYRNDEGLIAWWIGPDGYPIESRSGVVRWFVRAADDTLVWGDTKEEVRRKAPQICDENPDAPVSLTFIGAKLEDNPALTLKDPSYLSKLLLLPRVQRERKLKGNWKIRASAGTMFRRSWYEIVDDRPKRPLVRVRAWDLAASDPTPANPDPAYTAGVCYSRDRDGTFFVEHVERQQIGSAGVERMMVNTARLDAEDYPMTIQAMWQDPGGAGKYQRKRFSKLMARWSFHSEVARENKVTYAEPVSSQCEQGNVKLVRGPWNEAYIAEHEAFPDGSKKDQVDATSLAHIVCTDETVTALLMMTRR